MSNNRQIITGSQVRMARAFLKWSAKKLADEAGVALSTIKRIEQSDGIPNARVDNILSVKRALLSNTKLSFSENCVCIINDH